jgi:hypothetical protein
MTVEMDLAEELLEVHAKGCNSMPTKKLESSTLVINFPE